MRRPRPTLRARLALLPAALLIALWIPGASQGAYRVDTGLYAAIGLHAWREGPLWPLFAGDTPYFNKPPLPFLIHGLFLHLLGTDLWVARLPSLLAAIAALFVTHQIVRLISGPRTALITAGILALTLEFFRYTKAISLDLWLTLFLLIAAWSVARAIRNPPSITPPRRRAAHILLAGLPIGLALLVKPLVALLAIPIFALWIARHPRTTPRSPATHRGLAPDIAALAGASVIAVAIASLWYIPMYVRFGDSFIEQHFTKQAIERATGESFGADPWWYYLRLIAEKYWPWLIAVAATGYLLLRRRLDRAQRGAAFITFTWTLAWLAALSIFAGKSGRYAVPLYPFLAWLAAISITCHAPRWLALLRRGAVRWLAPIALLASLCISALGVRIHAPATPHWQALYKFVRAHDHTDLWAAPGMAPTCANIYLATGLWPRTATDSNTPPPGAILLYRDEIDARPPLHTPELWRSGPLFAVTTSTP
ncbi:MAG: glycosyltransferase family 39 protein [Phycisphaerae bacterium]|nr:glycosyltransferase family 39 protein [Phycisphaerae bacterium]